jgi:hypothetical protein
MIGGLISGIGIGLLYIATDSFEIAFAVSLFGLGIVASSDGGA